MLNEAVHLPRFLASCDAQTRRPERLLLVDDGSSDGSVELCEAFAAPRAWVETLRRPARPASKDRLRGAPELVAFLWALEERGGDEEVVVKMDADLELSPGHFALVLGALEADPGLGMAGTYLTARAPDGSQYREEHAEQHVRGPTRFYRRRCFEDVSPLPPLLGWDGADEVRARARVAHPELRHQRPAELPPPPDRQPGRAAARLRPLGGLRVRDRRPSGGRAGGGGPAGASAPARPRGAGLRRRVGDRPSARGGAVPGGRPHGDPSRAVRPAAPPSPPPAADVTTLLVAATGGHLKQLHQLRGRLWDVEGPYRWVTFDRPQSRSLLEGEDVEHVGFIGTRDPAGTLRGLGAARRIVSRADVTAVVSTGSAIALPYLLTGRALGRTCLYVESAARSQGPSVTGRLVSAIPGVACYAQYPAWANRRWRFRGAVFDAFAADRRTAPPRAITSVVVTLGTMTYPFDALVRRLLRVLPPGAEVLWQLGSTDPAPLGVRGVAAMPERELSAAMAAADVVVAHAGVGSALAALEVGKVPVLVPRRAARGEHVDDHQALIAAELEQRGLAVLAEADHLDLHHLHAAAAGEVTTVA